MTARLLSSFIWMGILIIPPTRVALGAIAVAVWPNKEPFASIGGPGSQWAPVAVLVVLGYFITAVLVRRALRSREMSGESSGGSVPPRMPMTVGLLFSAIWLSLLAVKGEVHYYHILICGLIVLGLWEHDSGTKPVPLPQPRPVQPEEDEEEYPEDSEDDQYFYRKYSWLFNEEPFRKAGNTHRLSLSMRIAKSIYDEYRARSHSVSGDSDYVRFINEELDDDVVRGVSGKIRALVDSHGFDELAEIHLAMAFTLSFSYASDVGGEYPKYPVETLVDRDGDCEDHANLCGAIFHGLGHSASLVLMEFSRGSGHAALAVGAPYSIPGTYFTDAKTGRNLFYCEVTPVENATTKETTAVQWRLGGDPMDGAHGFTLWEIGV